MSIAGASRSFILFLFSRARHAPRSTPLYSSAASDVYKRQLHSGLGQANFIGNLRKALTGLPQLYDFLPLSVVHRNTSVVVVYTFLFGHRQRQCGHAKPKKSNEQSNSALCSLLFRNIIYCSHVDCGQRATSASILYAASNLNLVVAFVFSHEYLTWNIHFPALSDYIGCPS